ncbi:hypothetical protein [Winogradskyella sp.]|uniref:hypothetical protein n=1 Tax=Winogradskyella sp. TaxID=1883156 RepID=UPI003F6B5451
MKLSQTKLLALSNHYIIWLKDSNTYIVFDKSNYKYFKKFQSSQTEATYLKDTAHFGNPDLANQIYNSLQVLCMPASQTDINLSDKEIRISGMKSCVLNYQQYCIMVHYNTQTSLALIASKFFHLKTKVNTKEVKGRHSIITQEDNSSYALQNNLNQTWIWQKNQPHLFQGKFSFEVLNSIHQKTEPDWIGTFHATTIGNGEQAVMLVGNSGSGKSTLATLLMYAGYDLVADDMSAMLAANNHIAVLPAALSIKEKAFATIAPLVDNFEDLPQQYINGTKGQVTYIPPLPLIHPEKLDYPCNNLVLVRYSQDPIPTTLTEGAEQTILQELITESWLAHNEAHAQSFLDWLGNVSFYELRYHNNTEAIAAVGSLFKK